MRKHGQLCPLVCRGQEIIIIPIKISFAQMTRAMFLGTEPLLIKSEQASKQVKFWIWFQTKSSQSQDSKSTPAAFIVFSLSTVILDTPLWLYADPRSPLVLFHSGPLLLLPFSCLPPLPIFPLFLPALSPFHCPSPFLHYCAPGRPFPRILLLAE